MMELTSYETFDVMASWKSDTGFLMTNLMSLLSAYLLVAYFAGSRLTRTQVILITGLLLWFVGVTVLQISINLGTIIEINEYDHANFGGGEDVLRWAMYGRWIIVSGCIAAQLACFKFMWDIRHAKDE